MPKARAGTGAIGPSSTSPPITVSDRGCANEPTQDQGEGRALHPLSTTELFGFPLASQLRPEGLKVDSDTANARVGGWMREVTNVRTRVI